MDCNAKFSEIFQNNVFTHLPVQDRSVIYSKYYSGTFCNGCQINVDTCSEVLINYISFYDLLSLNISVESWPEYILQSNHSATVQCNNCDSSSPIASFSAVLSDTLFVELNYEMARSYFSYAVNRNNENWILIDDLQDTCIFYDSLERLYEQHNSG